MTTPGSRWTLALALLAALCAIVPFATKPYHTDDPLFVWSGERIAAHAEAPYEGSVNWFGNTRPMLDAMWNPPGLPYSIALVRRAGGAGEAPLHWMLFASALCLLLAVHGFAVWTSRGAPSLAAIVVAASPAFLVSCTNVLPDVTTTAGVTAALFLWMRGVDSRRAVDLVSAALACAVAVSCKYFAASLIPMLAIYAIARRLPVRMWLPPLAIAALPLAAYEGWRWIETGALPSLSASRAVGGRSHSASESGFARVLSSIAFFGGACLPLAGIVVARVLRGAREMSRVRVPAIACVLAVLAAFTVDHASISSAASPGLVRVELACFLILAALLIVDLFRRWRDNEHPADRWLLAWIAWEIVYNACFNWSVMERGYLSGLALVAVIATRGLESVMRSRLSTAVVIAPIAVSFAVGIALNVADSEIAESARRCARDFVEPLVRAGHSVWFQGHWGFQYYAEEAGAAPIEVGTTRVASGAIVIVPMLNTNVAGVSKDEFRVVRVVSDLIRAPVTTLGPASGAGFYASVLGAVPFGVNLGEKSEFWVLERK